VSAEESASPAASGSSPLDKVRALQHTLYRAAKADPGRRFHARAGNTAAANGSDSA
jgi:RNA-directed DNA polymerase